MATMRAALVSPERQIWTGEASMVVARTLDGEIGVQPGHIPLLGVLAEGGEVRIYPADAHEPIRAAVDGGFLSVSADGVSVLAESAVLADEIDADAARAELNDAEPGSVQARRAEGRLRVAGQA